jgi:hypothetical protein
VIRERLETLWQALCGAPMTDDPPVADADTVGAERVEVAREPSVLVRWLVKQALGPARVAAGGEGAHP